MSCERYWREGIVLVERGLSDPHRETCLDCQRAHASRKELIEALPHVGAEEAGDPDWQAKVWRRIEGERERTPSRWRWQLGGALAMACVVVLWLGLFHTRSADAPPGEGVELPNIEIVKRGVPMRSQADPVVDDLLRVTVGKTFDVWIYRDDRLVLSCGARSRSEGCTPGAHAMVAELLLSVPGLYGVIVVKAPGALRPRGDRDQDIGVLESAGVSYEEHRVQVR